MSTPSPFLNSSPKDLAYALGETSRNLTLDTGTWYEIETYQNGKIINSSGRVREETLSNFHSEFKFYRRAKDKIRHKLRVTKFIRGYPYQASFPVTIDTPPPGNTGQVTVTVNGQKVQSSGAMRNARTWRSGLSRAYRARKPSVPRATALRPSPEIQTRPFLCTNEFGDWTSSSSFPTIETVTTYYRSWTGSRTPGWGSKRRTAYVDNDHTVVLAQVYENRSSWYQLRPANGAFQVVIKPYTSVFPVPSVPFLHVEEAEAKALKRLIQNAQMGIQANLALNIAQVSQLSGLIVSSTTRMTSAFRQLRRGNIPGAISAFGAGQDPRWRGKKGNPSAKNSLAQNWLELQYGWKPLLADIEGFLKVMGNQQGAQDFVQKARASGSASRQVTVNQPSTVTRNGADAGKTVFSYRSSCKFVIRYRMDNPLLALFSQTGFTNPINLFWEIIPFSFVVDWFLPIGNYLEALNAWQGATFLGGSRTRFTRMRTDSTVAHSGPHPADSNVSVLDYGNYRDEQIFLERKALTSFPSPVIPTLGNGIHAGNRAANAIALLTKALK